MKKRIFKIKRHRDKSLDVSLESVVSINMNEYSIRRFANHPHKDCLNKDYIDMSNSYLLFNHLKKETFNEQN